MITAKTPGECTRTELDEFRALVAAGDEVSATGLETRVERADLLLFDTDDDCTKGIAALKRPSQGYKEGVFAKAGARSAANRFSLELGWVFVLPSARGVGR